ncbi:hypothetical protein [Deinococcus hohokamensis]|uniref:Tetratricopeptide repeat protein n=1 Tax=Deinococcus hohokamensis TaxID=309883 RepID=A0ABV9IDV5_9DEIO
MRGLGLWLAVALLGSAQATAVLEGRTLRFEDGPTLVWQRSFPAALGDLSGPVEAGGLTYLGVGPAVYAFTPAGEVAGRADLPGQVTSLDAGSGSLRVSTQEAGYVERFTLTRQDGGLGVAERVVPPPDPAVTGWLAAAADLVPQKEVARASAADLTNPFLALREARLASAQGDLYASLSAVRRALNTTLPFPAWVMLAARLDAAGFPSAADLALEHARRDAAERGFDPELPVGRAALSAYGNPSAYAGTLLNQNRLTRAEAWMRYLRELHPRFEGGPALYERYAAVLATQGRAGEAEEWRQFARSLRGGTLYNLGLEGTRALRDAARLSALSLLLALLAALLTLTARAWRAQGEDTREYGGRFVAWGRRPLSRARRLTVAYASAGERLTLVLLSAALFTALGGWQWSNLVSSGLQAPALNTGTSGGGWVNAQLARLNLRPGPDTSLLSGLNAQLDGDLSVAREHYTRALPSPCALNNLGVIAQARGDEPQAREQYRAALAARPDLSAAAFNLGLSPSTPELTFQRTYRPDQPRLCYPDQRSLTRAMTGDLSATLMRNLREPLSLVTAAPGNSVRLGWALLGALALVAGLAFTLLLPRAASEARLGRPPAYRLLALLLPGAALLGGAWGSVLLLTWAASLAALLPLSGLVRFPELLDLSQPGVRLGLLGALGLSYLLNTLAFVTAEIRFARQARREAQPHT